MDQMQASAKHSIFTLQGFVLVYFVILDPYGNMFMHII